MHRSQVARGKSQGKFRGGEAHSKKKRGWAINSETAAEKKEHNGRNFSFKDWGCCLYTRDVNLQQSLQGETDGSSFRSSVPDTALNCSIIMRGAFRKSSTQHVLMEHPLQIRHCCRNWEYICEQNGQKSLEWKTVNKQPMIKHVQKKCCREN